jgi:hypothetical protein
LVQHAIDGVVDEALGAGRVVGAVVLVQLVPNLRREPSMVDAQSFRTLATKCASEGALVLDCVVVSGERWWSLGRLLSERAASN